MRVICFSVFAILVGFCESKVFLIQTDDVETNENITKGRKKLLPESGNKLNWCYQGDCGPRHWGENYEECNGRKQSPIDIKISHGTKPIKPRTPLLFENYDKVHFKQGGLKNNGYSAQLYVQDDLPPSVGILSGGHLPGKYRILQLHFHWGADDTRGSEHTLNGKMFPLELHIVHGKVGVQNFLKVDKGLTVTGFFFKVVPEDNPAIEPLVAALNNIVNAGDRTDMTDFQIVDLVDDVIDKGYSTYSGSLTTPGCAEVVNWINFLRPIKISASQLDKFRLLKDKSDNDLVDNFRPVQPLHGRKVVFYRN